MSACSQNLYTCVLRLCQHNMAGMNGHGLKLKFMHEVVVKTQYK